MSQAGLHAVLDNGEGLADCPACGDNLYVYAAIVTDLDTGEDYGGSRKVYPRKNWAILEKKKSAEPKNTVVL